MKRRIHLLALIPAMIFSTGCDMKKKNTVNVIILSGQSNAVGCKNSQLLIQSMGQEKYDEYLAGYEDIQIAFNNWDCRYDQPGRPIVLQNSSKKSEFTKVTLGQGNVPANFGWEVGMAEELHAKWGKKLYIIKCACGASNLNDDWADTNFVMFQNLKTFVDKKMQELKDNGLNTVLRAFCWMQGEGDSYPGYYPYYYDNLVRFKSNLDKAFLGYTEDNKLPFIDGGIGPGAAEGEETGEWQFYKEVNEQKQEFAALSDTNIYIDTIAAGLHSNKEPADNVHYDSESVIQLGHLFAKAYEPFLK